MVVQVIPESQAELSALIDKALAGEEVILAQAGKASCRLLPVEPAVPRRPRFGSMKGEIWIADDFDEFGPELQAMFGLG